MGRHIFLLNVTKSFFFVFPKTNMFCFPMYLSCFSRRRVFSSERSGCFLPEKDRYVEEVVSHFDLSPTYYTKIRCLNLLQNWNMGIQKSLHPKKHKSKHVDVNTVLQNTSHYLIAPPLLEHSLTLFRSQGGIT